MYEHKNKMIDGFTSRYNLTKLLYFEESRDPHSAILREKQIKKYSQAKKIKLIQSKNAGMYDLFDEIYNL